MSQNKKNFYIFFGIVFAVCIEILISPTKIQAQGATDCSQLDPTACQNPATSYICYPQWCGGPEVDINGGVNTQIWCKHRPCQWTGSTCIETPPGDETDALFEHCESKATADCSLGWEHVNVSQGWCITVDDECVGKKWCDYVKQYRIYYCEVSENWGACGYTAPDPPGTIESCDCTHSECEPECSYIEETLAEDECGKGIYCENCTCKTEVPSGEGPPEIICEPCPPGTKKGLVPCGRTCYGEKEGPEVCQPCKLCHFFVMLDNILDFVLFTLVPIIAILMLVIGGFLYICALFEFLPGGAELLSQAKRILTSVAIGLLIIYSAYLIIGMFLMIIGLADWTTEFYKTWWEEGFFVIPCD